MNKTSYANVMLVHKVVKNGNCISGKLGSPVRGWVSSKVGHKYMYAADSLKSCLGQKRILNFTPSLNKQTETKLYKYVYG